MAGVRSDRLVQQLRHVEAEDAGVEVERGRSSLSNSQACSPSPHQGRSRAARSPACGRRRRGTVRANSAGGDSAGCWSKLASTASAMMRAMSSASSVSPCAETSRASQSTRKARLRRRVGQRQRIEAGGLARADHVIAPADGADEDLGAAILVEIDDARLNLLGLREKEAQQHGLARARRADDGEIAEIAVVEIEMIGPGRCGLEHRDRRRPNDCHRLWPSG